MANRIIAAAYTAPSGNTFVVGVNEEVFDQVNGSSARLIGGDAMLPNVVTDPLPEQVKPRRALCTNAAGNQREVILLEADAPLATVGTTITLEDSDGVSSTYTCQEVRPHSYRRRKQQPV